MTTLTLRLLAFILSSGGRRCAICDLHVLADDAIGLVDGEVTHAECAAVHMLRAGGGASELDAPFDRHGPYPNQP